MSDNDNNKNIFHNFQTNLMSSISIFICFWTFLINLSIVLIHLHQSLFLKGYFSVTFMQNLMFAIISFLMIIFNIFNLLEFEIITFTVLFPLLFNFSYINIISYNIQTIIYLIIKKNTNNNDNSQIKKSSLFILMHIISFIIGFIHTFIFLFFYIKGKRGNNLYAFYFYFTQNYLDIINNKRDYIIKNLLFFILNYIYFILCIPFLCISFCNNENNGNNRTKLKNYAIYCFIGGFFGIIFIINKIGVIYLLSQDFNEKYIIYGIYCNSIITWIYIILSCIFRVRCYYVRYILTKNTIGGSGFFQRIVRGGEIVFCCQEVCNPDFVDQCNSYIFHALSVVSNFISDNSLLKKNDTYSSYDPDISDSDID